MLAQDLARRLLDEFRLPLLDYENRALAAAELHPLSRYQRIGDVEYVQGNAAGAERIRAAEQLQGYFAGERTAFQLAVRPVGSAFQRLVWDALREIPYGEPRSYGEIARMVGRPSAARAVGLANGRNPIPVIFACHRVIGADGALTGYAGGLQTKRALLDLERAVSQRRRGYG